MMTVPRITSLQKIYGLYGPEQHTVDLSEDVTTNKQGKIGLSGCKLDLGTMERFAAY